MFTCVSRGRAPVTPTARGPVHMPDRCVCVPSGVENTNSQIVHTAKTGRGGRFLHALRACSHCAWSKRLNCDWQSVENDMRVADVPVIVYRLSIPAVVH